MNKLLVIYACGLFSGSPMVEEQKSTIPLQPQVVEVSSFENSTAVSEKDTELNLVVERTSENMSRPTLHTEINNKVESDTALDFRYKPEIEDTLIDLNSIDFIEVEPEINLGFDTEAYLPVGFDPYGTPTDVHSIDFIAEDAIDLGFDANDYLPEGFDPYVAYFNIHDIEFIEVEEDFYIDFDSCLSEGNVYAAAFNIHSLEFIGDDDIELGFDTRPYLPEDFDPYTRSN